MMSVSISSVVLLLALCAVWIAIAPSRARTTSVIVACTVACACFVLLALRSTAALAIAEPSRPAEGFAWLESIAVEWRLGATALTQAWMVTTGAAFALLHLLHPLRPRRSRTLLLCVLQLGGIVSVTSASSFFALAFYQLGVLLFVFASLSDCFGPACAESAGAKSVEVARASRGLVPRIVLAATLVASLYVFTFAFTALWASAERFGASAFSVERLLGLRSGGQLEGPELLGLSFELWTSWGLLLGLVVPIALAPAYLITARSPGHGLRALACDRAASFAALCLTMLPCSLLLGMHFVLPLARPAWDSVVPWMPLCFGGLAVALGFVAILRSRSLTLVALAIVLFHLVALALALMTREAQAWTMVACRLAIVSLGAAACVSSAAWLESHPRATPRLRLVVAASCAVVACTLLVLPHRAVGASGGDVSYALLIGLLSPVGDGSSVVGGIPAGGGTSGAGAAFFVLLAGQGLLLFALLLAMLRTMRARSGTESVAGGAPRRAAPFLAVCACALFLAFAFVPFMESMLISPELREQALRLLRQASAEVGG